MMQNVRTLQDEALLTRRREKRRLKAQAKRQRRREQLRRLRDTHTKPIHPQDRLASRQISNSKNGTVQHIEPPQTSLFASSSTARLRSTTIAATKTILLTAPQKKWITNSDEEIRLQPHSTALTSSVLKPAERPARINTKLIFRKKALDIPLHNSLPDVRTAFDGFNQFILGDRTSTSSSSSSEHDEQESQDQALQSFVHIAAEGADQFSPFDISSHEYDLVEPNNSAPNGITQFAAPVDDTSSSNHDEDTSKAQLDFGIVSPVQQYQFHTPSPSESSMSDAVDDQDISPSKSTNEQLVITNIIAGNLSDEYHQDHGDHDGTVDEIQVYNSQNNRPSQAPTETDFSIEQQQELPAQTNVPDVKAGAENTASSEVISVTSYGPVTPESVETIGRLLDASTDQFAEDHDDEVIDELMAEAPQHVVNPIKIEQLHQAYVNATPSHLASGLAALETEVKPRHYEDDNESIASSVPSIIPARRPVSEEEQDIEITYVNASNQRGMKKAFACAEEVWNSLKTDTRSLSLTVEDQSYEDRGVRRSTRLNGDRRAREARNL